MVCKHAPLKIWQKNRSQKPKQGAVTTKWRVIQNGDKEIPSTKTNIASENRPSQKESIFQPSNFTGYVRFREGHHSVNPSSVHFIWVMVIWGPNTLLDNPFNLTTPWKLIVFQAVNWELLRAPQTTSSHKWAHYGGIFRENEESQDRCSSSVIIPRHEEMHN